MATPVLGSSSSSWFVHMLPIAASHASYSDLALELLAFVAPLWLAVLVGVILGWSWRPQWVNSLASDPRSSAIWSLLTGGPFKDAWSAGWSWGQAVLDSCGHVQVPGFTAAGAKEGVEGVKGPRFQPVGVLFGKDWSALSEKVLPWRAGERAAERGGGYGKVAAGESDGAGARRPESAEEFGERNGSRVTGPANGGAESHASTDEPSIQSLANDSLPPALRKGGFQKGGLQLLEIGRDVHGHGHGHGHANGHVSAHENGHTHGQGSEHGLAESDMELVLTEDDLEEFCAKVEGKDGGPEWQLMMEKSIKGMQYTGWRRDPEHGPTEYRSRTVMERCSAALMRDFFWDDEFRAAWDDMLVQARTITACERTGFQIVHWVRKFPFFCKDRDYVIARRIWSHDDTFYCITKGVHHPEVPKRDKPRRVEVFYSSWRIRPVVGAEGGDAAEVMLFHHEDMGLQRDIAKLGVRQGMWGAVRKMEPAIRKYERQRAETARPLSRCVSMANLHTPIVPSPGSSRDGEEDGEREGGAESKGRPRGGLKKGKGMGMRKWVSFSDLAMAGEARRREEREGRKEEEEGSKEEGGKRKERRVRVVEEVEGEGQSSSGRAGSSNVVVESGSGNVGERSPGEGSAVGSGDSRGRRRSGSGQHERSDSWDGGSEVMVRGGRGEERRGKKVATVRVGWVVATTALAFVCGVEAGVLMKLVLAGAVQNLASRRAAAAARKERLQN
ncbi:hypothetical protein CLOM_g11327 [Closterium sp. NIES-68]|nr:hypothetical protein CLOM_g11327 [Closterium sp. NIES-68]GJP61248.1 hypothetical protein CLOP_g18429 [Closterium sp. NIES-67]GJP77915.1 hypothetical protein CLOP_g8241 [Closterium sp. NIES-67]